MGSHITKPSNKSMVDRLVEHNSYIRSPLVEGVFRAVDRAMYFDLEEGEAIDPYEDDPWRRGNLHLSAPCIYARVVEALDLRSGLSFLNLGSGTGYLNTIVGLLVGPNGLNHGVELHADVVEYAYNRLQQFKQNSYAIDKYDFSEPVFIRGNCLNLNPNSKYDRIYLGAACLPDLETFMKKLIKPNGGILVMPYENHLVRYVRIGESDWRTEKLMDVNFTLMIRQGDNESMIDMPLAQAKSLKELCRINIRQHLRYKTNSMNPQLLHSDNISSRRMRKAKAERKMLRREEQRSKSKDMHFLESGRHRTTENKSPSKKQRSKRNEDESGCGCRCRRLVEEIEEPSVVAPTRELLKPSTSAASRTRVMTRAASRKLEKLATNPPDTSTGTPENRPDQSISSRDASPNGFDLRASSLDSSDSDDGDGDHHVDNSNYCRAAAGNNLTPGQDGNNCARTRPFVCTMRDRPSFSIPSAYRTSLAERRSDRLAPLLPFQRRMARIIDPPTSSSSSESSDDLPELDEYDYIGRRVVLDWPGFLRIHNADPAYDISDSPSISSDSTLSSNNNADPILDNSNSEDSWDSFFDNFHNNYDTMDDDDIDDEREAPSSIDSEDSHYEEDCYDIYDQDEDVKINNEEEEEGSSNAGALQPTSSGGSQTRVSKSLNDDCKALRKTSKSTSRSVNIDVKRPKNACDQEPVARRLRSKRLSCHKNVDELNDNDSSSNQALDTTQQSSLPDRPVPSCSRSELNRKELRHDSDCPMHRTPARRRRRLHKPLVADQPPTNRSPQPPAPAPQCSASANLGSNHSSVRHSSESSNADLMGHPSQGLFTGRFLIATAMGTTLSLAAAAHHHHHHHHHHLPSTSRSGSFRLFERRALNSIMPNRYHHHCHLQQLDRKRKRHSSSESSSDTSGSSSHTTTTSSRVQQKAGRTRRRCGCAPKTAQLSSAQSTSANSETSGPTPSVDNSHPRLTKAAQQQQQPDNPSDAQPRFIIPTRNTDTAQPNARGPGNRFACEDSISSSRQHHENQPNSHSHHHRHHRSRHICQNSLEAQQSSKRSRRAGHHNHQANHDSNGKRRKGNRTRDSRRQGDECARYHNHMSGYIRQLHLPRVLHSYLNYERIV